MRAPPAARALAADSTGGACVSCHSPDGIDLAAVGFSDCDVARRARDHLSDEEADAIVRLVRAHPDRYRPFQPGWIPLGDVEATDVEIADVDAQRARDDAFALTLADELQLIVATDTIAGAARATEAWRQLLELDLRDVVLGIPFDRLSEDLRPHTERGHGADAHRQGGERRAAFGEQHTLVGTMRRRRTHARPMSSAVPAAGWAPIPGASYTPHCRSRSFASEAEAALRFVGRPRRDQGCEGVALILPVAASSVQPSEARRTFRWPRRLSGARPTFYTRP